MTKLKFPKKLFTKKEVQDFRRDELEFPTKWDLDMNTRSFVLTFKRRKK